MMAVGTGNEPILEEEEEPNWSDDEDVKNINFNEQDLVGDILRRKPREEEAQESCVIIDGIPVVNVDRLPKLQAVLKKVLEKFGTVVSDYYPTDENGQNKGFMLAEFASPSNAEEAASVLTGYRLDKSHTFTANRISELNKLQAPDPQWVSPQTRPYTDLGNLRWWLTDMKCRDQYLTHWKSGETVSVFKNTFPEAQLASEYAQKDNWTETQVRWSPQGTFLTTMHKRGIATWAGRDFKQFQRYAQNDVQFIDYSPSEKFLVLCSEGNVNTKTQPNLSIWNVRTGELMRSFPYRPRKWPHFKWTHSDDLFACMRPGEIGEADTLIVYETQTFQALKAGGKVSISGLEAFDWSPKDNYLAYFVAEKDQNPARVALQRYPDKKELRSKNLFNVADASVIWQDSGDHLAVRIDRYGKKKIENREVKYSNVTTHVEIFRIREKDIPVESFELKEPLVELKWEPTGFKMCALQGSLLKSAPTFYSVQKGVQHMKTLDAKQGLNSILWAPQGSWVVACGLRSTSGGTFIFIDASQRDDVNVTQTVTHDAATDAAWDPTGRYFVTFVSVWKERSTDLGYRIWSFQGRELMRQTVDGFGTLMWRPRPPTLLQEDMIREVKKKIKTYAQRFEDDDSKDKGQASKEVRERMQTATAAFNEWRIAARIRYSLGETERNSMRPPVLVDEDMEEETIELPLERSETILIAAPED